MRTNIIIVGQGIAGTLLSWFLHKAGADFIVIDDNRPNSSSIVAAGLINPVTGRRVVKVWLDDILLPFAEKTYQEIGDFLGITALFKTRILDFFPNPFMKEIFLKKLEQPIPYIQMIEDPEYFKEYFNYEFGCGTIDPGYVVQVSPLQQQWRNYLQTTHRFFETEVNFNNLSVEPGRVLYKEIEAKLIIFCDGALGGNNPYFKTLPFALHKGEALIIEAFDLPSDYIYKKNLMLAPLAEKGTFWAGTNYIWDYANEGPTQAFREEAESKLKNWLKLPFKILGQRASIRPATVERRPFVGFHPKYQNVGILNGLGTKGFSLAPYFAHQLCENLLNGKAILPEADIARFRGALSR